MKPRPAKFTSRLLVSEGLQITNHGIPFGASPDALKGHFCASIKRDVQFIETCLNQSSGQRGRQLHRIRAKVDIWDTKLFSYPDEGYKVWIQGRFGAAHQPKMSGPARHLIRPAQESFLA